MNNAIWFCTAALCAIAMVSCESTHRDTCLSSLGAEQVSLPSSSTINYSTQTADNEVRDCLIRMFGGQTLNTPLAFDDSYRRCLNYHREDNTLVYAALPHDKTFVLHLDSTDQYDVYLLHEETGRTVDGTYYDVLFTADKHGTLINQLLVGATGTLYTRSFSILPSQKFRIIETTGREGNTGPNYKAEFSINISGKFVLVQSTTEQTSESGDTDNGSDRAEELSEQTNAKSYNDIIGIEKGKDIKSSLEDILFSEGQSEDYFEPHTFFGKKCWLAVSQITAQESGVADFSFILVQPLPEGTSTDKSVRMYKTEGYALPGGREAELLGGEIKNVSSAKKGNNYLITLTLRRSWLAPGGDPNTKALTQRYTETKYVFTYNEAGELKLQQ